MSLESHKEHQRDQWDSVALGWKKWWPTIENGAQHVSERMITLAAIAPGHRVLDLATGIGEPAVLAASRVGPAGRVVATDLSSRMLDIARERAIGLGLANVEFIEADIEHLPFPDGGFDAILCRWGLASLSNAAKTLVSLRRLLAPNGSFVSAVWAEGPRGRPLASLVTSVTKEVFSIPSPVPATSISPRSEAETLAKDLSHAGYIDIRSEEIELTLEFESSADCFQYLRDVSPDMTTLLSDKSSEQTAAFQRRLAEGLQQFAIADGSVRVTNLTICVVGRTA
jgi:ubiquinone/menaquinone biosynthesis C-methylase UbiE